MGVVSVFLGEDRLEHGDDGGALLCTDMRQCVEHPVHPVALLGRVEHLACGAAQPLMIVGDDELDAAQPAIGERAQEALSERFGL